MQKILLMSKFDIHSLTISRYLELSGLSTHQLHIVELPLSISLHVFRMCYFAKDSATSVMQNFCGTASR